VLLTCAYKGYEQEKTDGQPKPSTGITRSILEDTLPFGSELSQGEVLTMRGRCWSNDSFDCVFNHSLLSLLLTSHFAGFEYSASWSDILMVPMLSKSALSFVAFVSSSVVTFFPNTSVTFFPWSM
jgi:hypothetical protein